MKAILLALFLLSAHSPAFAAQKKKAPKAKPKTEAVQEKQATAEEANAERKPAAKTTKPAKTKKSKRASRDLEVPPAPLPR